MPNFLSPLTSGRMSVNFSSRCCLSGSFNGPSHFFNKSTLGKKARLLDFTLASFVFVLNYRHRGTVLDHTPQSQHRIRVFNAQHSLYAQTSLGVLWYSWSNFLSVLFSLAFRRCSILVLASPSLNLLAQAISRYTFSGTYLQWKSSAYFLDHPQKVVSLAKGLPQTLSSAVLLFRPVTSYTAYAALRKARMPLLGYAGTLLGEQLLWQNAGLYSTDLNFQYLLFVTYWVFFTKVAGLI